MNVSQTLVPRVLLAVAVLLTGSWLLLPAQALTAPSADSTSSAIAVWLAPQGQTRGSDPTALPLGDGRSSREGPAVGNVWTCNAPNPNAGGAQLAGPWIRGDGTFDLTAKAEVDGDVAWPHELRITLAEERRLITGNGLPSHPTGVYPGARTDDAYQYDRNPNSITPQALRLDIPATPSVAAQPACLPGGGIGVLLTGAAFFNALDAPGRDAVAHETMDACHGHPERTGQYHYHHLTPCIPDDAPPGSHSPLVGYASDGFGLFGRHGESGLELTNADLDECHGHTHEVLWDAQPASIYHYHATWEFPYTLACFRGTPTGRPIGPGPV